MKKRLVMGVLLSVTLVGLTGCPPLQVSPGTWLFTVSTDDSSFLIALNLEDGGGTQDPDPRPPDTQLFDGVLFWEQDGSDFTLSQFGGDFSAKYSGIVNSATSMSGTWSLVPSSGPIVSGTWSAEKL